MLYAVHVRAFSSGVAFLLTRCTPCPIFLYPTPIPVKISGVPL